MVTLLSKWFIKNRDDREDPKVRSAYGVLCGALGILLNLLLFLGKFLVGRLAGSIAVTADAFNNLSDAGSSLVTVLGFRMAGQKPDPEHPFGHGRFEYLAGLVVSLVILLMGVELMQGSIEKIASPQPARFSPLGVGVLAASIAVKAYMAFYNTRVGKRISSAAMSAAARDSLSDCAATLMVLASMLIDRFTGVAVDGWAGLLVACFILYSGVRAAIDTVNPLLGQPPEKDMVCRIQRLVLSHEAVIGMHDLVVHDYGPGRRMISLHAEVPASGDLNLLHDVIDNIERDLKEELSCEAVIHMDPVDTDDERTNQTRQKITELVKLIDERVTIHDFRMVTGPTHTNVIFDIVVPYAFHRGDEELERDVQRMVRALDGNYYAVVNIDRSYTKLEAN